MITRLAQHQDSATAIMTALQYVLDLELVVLLSCSSLFHVYSRTELVCFVRVCVRSLAKLHDLNIPLVRNQNTIIKNLMTHRKEIFDHAYIDEGSDPEIAAKRHDLLSNKVATIRTPTCRFVVSPMPSAYHS